MDIPIQLTSAPNEGCCFTLTLTACEPVAKKEPKIGQSRPLKIFLIEDDFQQRLYVNALLKDWGHSIVSVDDVHEPEATLEGLDLSDVDLVLADYQLGKQLTGLHWIKKIRERKPNLPALLVSASSDPEVPASCHDENVGYLPKPVTPVSLKIWLERHSAQ